jgi:mRNA-degrading endonuclease RelE of RelBE toxin-antitoxin system
MGRFSEQEVENVKEALQREPKGNPASHWKIKKVAKNIWQYDLPEGYRLEYTVVDEIETVFILFTGSHDDAAAYLRGKK